MIDNRVCNCNNLIDEWVYQIILIHDNGEEKHHQENEEIVDCFYCVHSKSILLYTDSVKVTNVMTFI